MKHIFVYLIAILLLVSTSAFAANTVATSNSAVQISAIDSDWSPTKAIWVKSIELRPGATSDILIVKDGTDAGPAIVAIISVTGNSIIKYFDSLYVLPVLDFSASTLSSGAIVVIIYESR